MKNILAFVFLFFTTSIFAQQGAIRGTILDHEMNNEPLLFATISIKNSTITKQTNLFGNFEINDLKPRNYTLQISFAGYSTKEVPIKIHADETIEIQESLAALQLNIDEAVFIESKNNTKKITALTSSTSK